MHVDVEKSNMIRCRCFVNVDAAEPLATPQNLFRELDLCPGRFDVDVYDVEIMRCPGRYDASVNDVDMR